MREQFPELVYGFDFKRIDLDEKHFVVYTDSGEKTGETILFVHGLMSYIPAWAKVIPELSKTFRCIAIDLPGYGKSSGGVNPGTVSFYVDILVKFVKKLNLGKVNLAGHSMGGQIAIAMALKHPELIKKLILLAPAGFETFSFFENVMIKKYASPKMFQDASEEQIRKSWAGNFFRMPEEVAEMLKDSLEMKRWGGFGDYCEVVYNSVLGLLKEPVFSSLKKLNCRTLIFFGKDDAQIPNRYIHKNTTPEEIAKKGASEIRNAKLVLIEQCGHFIQYEKPDVVIREMQSFLEE